MVVFFFYSTEPRQLRSYPRKSARERSPAPTPIQKCRACTIARQLLELEQLFLLLHLSDTGLRFVIWDVEIYLPEHKARQTHPHATPSVLSLIAV